ncbi:MAG: AIR synthase-related protein [Collinsella sp.]
MRGRRHPRPALGPQLRLPGDARDRRGRPDRPVAETLRRQAAAAQARDHGRAQATPPTATRSAWPPARCTRSTTPATSPSAWRSARSSGAAPREARASARHPQPGDIVILLGGTHRPRRHAAARPAPPRRTPRSRSRPAAQRCRRATPPEERKIQRLFRDGDACRMIKRCNDFGAGGVSVAIGELADGLDIDLNAVPKKYDGLDGTELAISESQERMAVRCRLKGRRCLHGATPPRRTSRPPLVAEVTDEHARAHDLERRHHRRRVPRVPQLPTARPSTQDAHAGALPTACGSAMLDAGHRRSPSA